MYDRCRAAQYRQIEDMMKIPGIGAYVLVSNRLDQKNEGEAVFEANAQEIFDRYPEIDFGIYECPMPWKRLVTTEFLRKAGQQGRMVAVWPEATTWIRPSTASAVARAMSSFSCSGR